MKFKSLSVYYEVTIFVDQQEAICYAIIDGSQLGVTNKKWINFFSQK